MGFVRQTGIRPQSLKCAAEAIYEGYLYQDDGSGRMTVAANEGDSIVAVAIESSIDYQTAAAKTLTAGMRMPFAMIGTGAVVDCASENAATYQEHAAVYATANTGTSGYVTSANTNSAATKIGHYAGKDAYATTVAGELIPVRLDVFPVA